MLLVTASLCRCSPGLMGEDRHPAVFPSSVPQYGPHLETDWGPELTLNTKPPVQQGNM